MIPFSRRIRLLKLYTWTCSRGKTKTKTISTENSESFHIALTKYIVFCSYHDLFKFRILSVLYVCSVEGKPVEELTASANERLTGCRVRFRVNAHVLQLSRQHHVTWTRLWLVMITLMNIHEEQVMTQARYCALNAPPPGRGGACFGGELRQESTRNQNRFSTDELSWVRMYHYYHY